MKLFVSCIPYDKGKSGISVYAREVVAALAAQGLRAIATKTYCPVV